MSRRIRAHDIVEGMIDDEIFDGTLSLYESIKERMGDRPIDSYLIEEIVHKIASTLIHLYVQDEENQILTQK